MWSNVFSIELAGFHQQSIRLDIGLLPTDCGIWIDAGPVLGGLWIDLCSMFQPWPLVLMLLGT